MAFRRRIRRRFKRFVRRGRRSFGKRRFTRRSLRFRGFRRGRRYGRRSSRRRFGGRTRIASKSTRSSGNVGQRYARFNVRVNRESTRYFPFTDSEIYGSRCVYWSHESSVPKGQFVQLDTSTKAITVPGALAPSNTTALLQGTLCGYITVSLNDVLATLDLDRLLQYSHYRIKRITYRVRDTRAVPVARVGIDFQGPGGTVPEVALVNTSMTGQFIRQEPMSNTLVSAKQSPYEQVRNWPSVRNIAKFRSWRPGRANSLSMVCDATEDYFYMENNVRAQQLSNLAGSGGNGYQPRQLWDAPGVTLAVDQNRYVKRRRFRWSRMFTRYQVGNSLNILLSDIKLAHGVQILVREGTYSRQSVPYMNVDCRFSIEFRSDGRSNLLQDYIQAVDPAVPFLFPFTNTMAY